MRHQVRGTLWITPDRPGSAPHDIGVRTASPLCAPPRQDVYRDGVNRLDLDLGSRLVPFREGRELQRRIHADVADGRRASTLILLEHEAVYTVGRRAHSWERPDGAFVEPGHVPVLDVDRGGKTTWHGPGQLTVYPIVRLARPIDVIKYVRALEAAVMEVCAAYGVGTRRVAGRSGVWVPADPALAAPADPAGLPAPGGRHPETPTAETRRSDRPAPGGRDGEGVGGRVGGSSPPPPGPRPERKICALGVRVARGATMHGIGLNVDPDLEAFSLSRIIPCGIDDAGVTSLSAETGRPLATADPADVLTAALERNLAPLVADAALS